MPVAREQAVTSSSSTASTLWSDGPSSYMPTPDEGDLRGDLVESTELGPHAPPALNESLSSLLPYEKPADCMSERDVLEEVIGTPGKVPAIGACFEQAEANDEDVSVSLASMPPLSPATITNFTEASKSPLSPDSGLSQPSDAAAASAAADRPRPKKGRKERRPPPFGATSTTDTATLPSSVATAPLSRPSDPAGEEATIEEAWSDDEESDDARGRRPAAREHASATAEGGFSGKRYALAKYEESSPQRHSGVAESEAAQQEKQAAAASKKKAKKAAQVSYDRPWRTKGRSRSRGRGGSRTPDRSQMPSLSLGPSPAAAAAASAAAAGEQPPSPALGPVGAGGSVRRPRTTSVRSDRSLDASAAEPSPVPTRGGRPQYDGVRDPRATTRNRIVHNAQAPRRSREKYGCVSRARSEPGRSQVEMPHDGDGGLIGPLSPPPRLAPEGSGAGAGLSGSVQASSPGRYSRSSSVPTVSGRSVPMSPACLASSSVGGPHLARMLSDTLRKVDVRDYSQFLSRDSPLSQQDLFLASGLPKLGSRVNGWEVARSLELVHESLQPSRDHVHVASNDFITSGAYSMGSGAVVKHAKPAEAKKVSAKDRELLAACEMGLRLLDELSSVRQQSLEKQHAAGKRYKTLQGRVTEMKAVQDAQVCEITELRAKMDHMAEVHAREGEQRKENAHYHEKKAEAMLREARRMEKEAKKATATAKALRDEVNRRNSLDADRRVVEGYFRKWNVAGVAGTGDGGPAGRAERVELRAALATLEQKHVAVTAELEEKCAYYDQELRGLARQLSETMDAKEELQHHLADYAADLKEARTVIRYFEARAVEMGLGLDAHWRREAADAEAQARGELEVMHAFVRRCRREEEQRLLADARQASPPRACRVRAYLGIDVSDGVAMRSEVRRRLTSSGGIEEGSGVRVVDVDATGPACQAGVRGGDIVVSLGSTPISDVAAFRAAALALRPSTHVSLRYLRKTAGSSHYALHTSVVRSRCTAETVGQKRYSYGRDEDGSVGNNPFSPPRGRSSSPRSVKARGGSAAASPGRARSERSDRSGLSPARSPAARHRSTGPVVGDDVSPARYATIMSLSPRGTRCVSPGRANASPPPRHA